jgi:uncharacterized protein
MEKVNELIQSIAEKKGVTILYACETGSRAWGFPSPDSDFDVRFVYMHNRDWYLSLGKRKDTIEYMEGDWDITGWDLRKCLLLLKKSNVPLVERFQSPMEYYAQEGFKADFQALIAQYYSPTAVFFHHYALAHKFWQAIQGQAAYKLKSYFYLVRSLLSCYWITKDSTVLPMHIEGLMKYVDKENGERLRKLIALKATVGESYLHPVDVSLHAWVSELFAHVEAEKNNLGVCRQGMQPLDAFFLKMVYG